MGVSAISQIGDFYLQNERELEGYYARLDQGQHPASRGFRVSHEDKLRRYIIMSLICELRLDIPECSRRFGIDFSGTFHQELLELRTMEGDGLCTYRPRGDTGQSPWQTLFAQYVYVI